MCSSSDLPPDLEAIALKQFDTLLDQGQIFYEPPKTSIRWAQGFQVHIRFLRALMHTNAVGHCELNTRPV